MKRERECNSKDYCEYDKDLEQRSIGNWNVVPSDLLRRCSSRCQPQKVKVEFHHNI